MLRYEFPKEAFYIVCVDTKAGENLSLIINNTNFCKDVAKRLPQHQTSCFEAFQSLVINFAPRSTAFSYSGMLSFMVGIILIICI